MTAIACTLTFTGCTEDVYDPERGIQTEPKENPLGEDFIAPDGFNWSMINSINLNVAVKDEFNGRYNYLIEVFTANPLNDPAATPIAAGMAKGGSDYTAGINISNAIKRLYIRQTDPKQRKEIYEYEVPEHGGTLHCKPYIAQTDTRAYGTAHAESAIADPSYTEPAIPADAKELKNEDYPWGCSLWNARNYLIKSGTTFSQPITAGQGVNIYIQGTCSGKSITLQNNATLTVSSDGQADCTSLTAQSASRIKNFNVLTTDHAKLQESAEFYNKGIFTGKTRIEIQAGSVRFYNLGTTVSSKEFHAGTSQILNKGEIKATGLFSLVSAQLDNQGEIGTVHPADKLTIQMNGNSDAILNNFGNATIHATSIMNGSTVNNHGTIVLNTYDTQNNGASSIYNACTFIISDLFVFSGTLILDNGSITGPQDGKTWKPVKNFTFYNSAKAILKNSSIILAEKLTGGNTGTCTGEGTSLSMIKAAETYYPGKNTFNGLILDLGKEYVRKYNWQDNKTDYYPLGSEDWQVTKTHCSSVGTDASKYTVETCAGIIYDGNEGSTPTNPEFPIETGESNVYTFAFEDNWPAYGDFELNDLVLVMPVKKLQLNGDNHVTRLRMRIEVRAVGASKTLGAGIRFLQLPAGLQPDKFTVNGTASSFEKGQNAPTYILFDNAHLTLWGNDDYKENGPFINTLPNGVNCKYDTKGFDIIMEIPASAGIKADAFNINHIDVFAITSPATVKSLRTEVHVVGFKPTELANTRYFDQGNDRSLTKGQYYVSNENLAWAVVIPTEFPWPMEHYKISSVYPYFKKWVTTGGKEDGDESGNGKWYNYNNGEIYPLTQLSPIKED